MTDKTDSKERDLMALVDAYAEARHIGGCHTYNAKTAEARNAVIAKLAASAGSEPVAYAMFADNGNIRLWSKARIPHPDAKPLYLHPSPPEGMVMVPREPTPAMIEAGRWMEYGESSCHMGSVPDGDVIGVWQSMIAAAPPTSSADSRKGD